MTLSVFGHVVALALLIFVQLKLQAEATPVFEEAEIVDSVEKAGRVKRAYYPDEGYLAGDMMPVWLACEGPDGMVYERLQDGYVAKALVYYKSQKVDLVSKRRRSVVKRSTETRSPAPAKEKFVYPSVLIMMEYQASYPDNDLHSQELFVLNKILYAMAYWNEVHTHFRNIRHPGVRIRMAGLVLAKHGLAYNRTHHSFDNWAGLKPTIDIFHSLNDQLAHWNEATNNYFNASDFTVVATMTDYKPTPGTQYSWAERYENCNFLRNHNRPSNALMVYDDQDFSSISHTIGEMAHLLGRRYVGDSSPVTAKYFTRNDIDDIHKHISKFPQCWKNVGEPPGRGATMIFLQDLYKHY